MPDKECPNCDGAGRDSCPQGYDHQMPPEDMVSYLEMAYVAMDAHADTIAETLDISDDEMERLAAQLHKILHRPEKSEDSIKDFCSALSPEEKMLITLRDELYTGSWEEMIQDLKYRSKKTPYIFKLVNRINADIERARKLQQFELKHDVNLADYHREQDSKET